MLLALSSFSPPSSGKEEKESDKIKGDKTEHPFKEREREFSRLPISRNSLNPLKIFWCRYLHFAFVFLSVIWLISRTSLSFSLSAISSKLSLSLSLFLVSLSASIRKTCYDGRKENRCCCRQRGDHIIPEKKEPLALPNNEVRNAPNVGVFFFPDKKLLYALIAAIAHVVLGC